MHENTSVWGRVVSGAKVWRFRGRFVVGQNEPGRLSGNGSPELTGRPAVDFEGSERVLRGLDGMLWQQRSGRVIDIVDGNGRTRREKRSEAANSLGER